MPKRLALILTLLVLAFHAFPQTSLIRYTKTKTVQREDGQWNAWPSEWSHNTKEAIIVINDYEDGDFHLQMFIDDVQVAEVYASYDEEISTMKQEDWNNSEIHCYKEDEGEDYIYLKNASLKTLAEDPKQWDEADASLYLWVFSEDYAVLLK